MSNIIQTTKRQVEILSLIEKNAAKYSVGDMEDMFNVGKATIERDLQQIRSWGIALHSVKGELRLVKKLSEKQRVEILSLYVTFSHSQSVLHKSLTLVARHLKEGTMATFISINEAIEQRRVLKFTYLNFETNTKEERTVNPYGITLLDGRWLVVGYAEERKQLRHFLVENMSDVIILEKRFKSDKNFELAKYYKNVWGRWHDDKSYNVKIWFDKSVSHIIAGRQWHTNQKVKKQKDGSVIFEAKVSGLYEIKNWILPWGKLARVLGPIELKLSVIKISNEIIEQYK